MVSLGYKIPVSPRELATLSLLSPEDLARWHANAEARRVARARLYYLDELATAVAVAHGADYDGVKRPMTALPPSTYGMIMWASNVASTPQGAPIIACHREVGDSDVRVAWWADAIVAAIIGVDLDDPVQKKRAEQVISTYGVLMQEEEACLEYEQAAAGASWTLSSTESAASPRSPAPPSRPGSSCTIPQLSRPRRIPA